MWFEESFSGVGGEEGLEGQGVSTQMNSTARAWADVLRHARSSPGKTHGQILTPAVVSFLLLQGCKEVCGAL